MLLLLLVARTILVKSLVFQELLSVRVVPKVEYWENLEKNVFTCWMPFCHPNKKQSIKKQASSNIINTQTT